MATIIVAGLSGPIVKKSVMGYVLPQFNLLSSAWVVPRRASSGPPDATDIPSQLYVYSRPLMDIQYGEKEMWVPPVTLRLPIEEFLIWSLLGLVEVPAGSGRYYLARWKERMHMGFPNEYLIAIVDQCTPEGVPIARNVTYPLPPLPTTTTTIPPTTSTTTSTTSTTPGPTTTTSTTPGPTTTTSTTPGPTTTTTTTTTTTLPPVGMACSNPFLLTLGRTTYSVSIPVGATRWYRWTADGSSVTVSTPEVSEIHMTSDCVIDFNSGLSPQVGPNATFQFSVKNLDSVTITMLTLA